MRFLGNITAKSDSKGRVFLPSVMRKVLQANGEEKLVMRKDIFQDCLVLFPESVWNEKVDELRSRLNYFNRTHQQVMRQFVADTELLTLDASGRILINKHYMEKAGINSEVHFIGVNDTIEIWAAEKMEQPFMSNEDFGQTLEELMK
ncbi:MAG: division/cell wall cluster transcriptional repressor MraZ [Bacteroidaceae bacterium]|nr:division/cell wall cluster transcriptional repressor MraZ [Bacteroidaceae bacterium]